MTAPTPDLDALVAAGERRLRRRRAVVALGATAIVVVLVVAGLLVNGVDEQTDAPVDRPKQHQQVAAPAVREIVYSDVAQTDTGMRGSTIHYGDRTVRTGDGFVHTDVTDDGFVYLVDAKGVWFSDGGRPEQVGRLCHPSLGRTPDDVLSANTGSRVLWLDCTTGRRPELVVLDTSTSRELLRRPMPRCSFSASSYGCMPTAFVGDHAYLTRLFARHGNGRVVAQGLLVDVRTGHVTDVTRPYVQRGSLLDSPAYVEDLRTHPRGLVVGRRWESGLPTDGVGQHFGVVGARLVPSVDLPDGRSRDRSRAFDTATGRQVRLNVPQGYHRADTFSLFEWLDDDTVALVGAGGGWPGGRGYGDILRCHLTTGRCVLVVRGHGGGERDDVRVVPSLGLPG